MSLEAGIGRREFLKDAALFMGGFLGLDTLLRTGVLAEDKLEDELEELFIRPYAEKVYQNTKPVIVLHSGPGFDGSAVVPCDRMRKVLLEVQKKYVEQIVFYEFKWENFLPVSNNSDKTQEYNKWFYDERFHKNMSDITGHPSTWMYHRKDILTNEKYKENHLIDIIGGGPTDDKYIPAWVGDINDTNKASVCGWINLNIVKSNGQYTWRLNNSGSPEKYEY